MSNGPTPPHLERADAFLVRLQRWAELRTDIRALLVVGSYARADARPDSDLDVLLLVENPRAYLDDVSFMHELGTVRESRVEDYGRVTSLRVHFDDGLEAELGVAPRNWASEPHDAGTLRVVKGGVRILFDRDGDVGRLVDFAAKF